jgi:Ca-activated chloride channel family protein
MDKVLEHIVSFNWENFHWISSTWLWVLIPIWIVGLGIVLLDKEQNKWQHYIADHLKSQVIQKGESWKNQLPLLLFLILTSGLIVALAQPTWEQEKSPSMNISSQAIIAMEVSPSMLEDDLEPNRLERAKLKVNDLLESNPEVKVGLHVFGGSPHIVLPPTADYHLIAHHTKSFKTTMMPVEGDDLAQYFDLIADTVFQQYESPSTLVLITDSWTSESELLVNQFVSSSIHQVKVLLVAAGHNVISTSNERIELIPITLDTTDVAHIAHELSASKTFLKDGKEVKDQWVDMGWLLLIPIALIALLFFRKGFTVLPVGIMLMSVLSSCSYDSPIAPYLYDQNTLAEAYYQAGRFEEVLTFSSDPELRAAAYYQLGDYESAAQLYQLDSAQNGSYNFALALTNMGYYDSALAILKAAGVDSSQFMLVENYIDSNRIVVLGEGDAKENQKTDGPLEERRAKGKDEELSSDTETDELPKSGKRVTDEVESEVHKAKEMEFPPEETEQGQEMEPKNILLQKSSSDPSEFLRKRFKLQYKRRTEQDG